MADTVCVGSDAVLNSQTQSPWEIQWYTAPNGGFPIGSGDQFTLPNVGGDSVLYVASGLSGIMGLADSSVATGAFVQGTSGKQFFTLDRDARLASVDMIVESSGLRLIQVFRDLQANTVLQAIRVATLDPGKQTVQLDMDLPAGNYYITMSGVGGAYSQTSGVTYPFAIPGLGTMTSADPIADAYYYFYDMRFVAENACPRETVTITAQDVDAVAAFTLDNTTPDLPDNATINFTDQSSNAQSYFWDFGDSTTSTDPSPQHAYTQPGTYAIALTVTDANGCSNTTVDSITVTGFPTNIEPNLNLRFSLYPNPGVQQVFIGMGQPNEVEIEVRNVTGKRLLVQPMDVSGKMSLDLGSLADGVYLIVARDGAKQYTQKWVKQAR
ncbi:MAG: PKD domain-containing protein [Bacteroidota bacterium]